jgi:hypothetical protein
MNRGGLCIVSLLVGLAVPALAMAAEGDGQARPWWEPVLGIGCALSFLGGILAGVIAVIYNSFFGSAGRERYSWRAFLGGIVFVGGLIAGVTVYASVGESFWPNMASLSACVLGVVYMFYNMNKAQN